jgi:hypothetical protein
MKGFVASAAFLSRHFLNCRKISITRKMGRGWRGHSPPRAAIALGSSEEEELMMS